MRSGESFQSRVKRAKGKRHQADNVGRTVGFGLTIVFALVILAGFLYQQRATKVIRDSEREYTDYAARLQRLELLVEEGEYQQARGMGERLIEELNQKAESIKIEVAPTTEQKESGETAPKAIRKAEKRLLQNLAAKAKKKLKGIPAG
jgi:predicted PilT family ATPase